MQRTWHAASVAALSVLVLAACDDNAGGRTVGQQLDSALARTEHAGAETVAKTRELAAEARAKLESSDVQERLRSAGATLSTNVADSTITAKVSAGLARDPDLSALTIDVDTTAGKVVMRGTAPTNVARLRAEQIAKSTEGVVTVENLLTLRPSTP